MPPTKPEPAPDAEATGLTRAAEYLILVAPFLAALAFGVVEPWSRWGLLAFAFVPALLLRFPVDACAGAFFAFGTIALMQSRFFLQPDGPARTFGSAMPQASADAATTWFAAGLLASCAARLRAQDRTFPKRMALSLAASAVAVSVAGFVQISSGNAAIYGIRLVMSGVAPFAGFYNRNHAAAFLGAGAILAFAALATMRRESSLIDHRAKQATWLVPVAVIWAAMWNSESRGALVAQAAALALFLGLPIWAFAATAAVLGLAASWNSSMPIRAEIYASTAGAVLDRLSAGWGAGSFPSVSPYFIPRSVGLTTHAHSSLLDAAFEFGAPLAVAGALLAAFRAFRSAREGGPIERAFAAAAAACLLHGVFESTLYSGANLAVLAICLALCASARPAPWARLGAPVVVLACAAFAWPVARDSFSRLTRAAYFSNSPLADDLAAPASPRAMIEKYGDAARSPWDWRMSAVRQSALSAASRPADADHFSSRASALRGP